MSNHDRDDSQRSDRDASLNKAWREASVDQPSARLDAAIIAAARKAVADHGQPQVAPPVRRASRNWFAQWQPLAAAAMVAGLAFVLVQTLPRERNRELPTQWPESAPAAASAKAQPESPRSPEQTDEAPATGREKFLSGDQSKGLGALGQLGETSAASRQDAIPAPPAERAEAVSSAGKATASDSASAAAPVAASTERNEVSEDVASGVDRKAAESDTAGRAAAPAMSAPATVSSRERSLSTAAPPSSAARAADIAARYSADDLAGAATALREFRAVDPDADRYLPPSLHDWALTVQ